MHILLRKLFKTTYLNTFSLHINLTTIKFSNSNSCSSHDSKENSPAISNKQLVTKNLNEFPPDLCPLYNSQDVKDAYSILGQFISREDVKIAAIEHGIMENELNELLKKFQDYYTNFWRSDIEIKIILADLEKGYGNITDLLPYFLKFAYKFRNIDNVEIKIREIVNNAISQLTKYYIDARHIKRKVIFHTGPTNSGKTHNALKRFLDAPSGVYAAPLRVLSYEMRNRSMDSGVPCDLLTGELKVYAKSESEPSAHISCTTEMVPIEMHYSSVGVIDEIQLLCDYERGAAWLRALFGLCVDELHLCGHKSVVPLVEKLLTFTNEEVEVRNYERLSPLKFLPTSLKSNFKNIEEGDCIVSFNRNHLHKLKAQIEHHTGFKCAIIYGSLPPSVRSRQIKLFNAKDSEYKVCVASDAIGLGVNLNIKRVVFYSLTKYSHEGHGLLSPQLVSQVSGRAGRYLSRYPEGYVTCFEDKYYHTLKNIFNTEVPERTQAIFDLPPNTWDLIRYMLPQLDMKQLSKLIASLVDPKSIFQLVNKKEYNAFNAIAKKFGISLLMQFGLFNCFMDLTSPLALKIVEIFLTNYYLSKVTYLEDVCRITEYPLLPPLNSDEIMKCEDVIDIMELYLWLNQRSKEFFPDSEGVLDVKNDIEEMMASTLQRATCYSAMYQTVFYIPDKNYIKECRKYLKNVFIDSGLLENSKLFNSHIAEKLNAMESIMYSSEFHSQNLFSKRNV